MDENGGVEEDDGPWGSLVVLSSKPHQENAPWHKYHWSLCVFYQKLNQVTRPFAFPILFCGDVVQDIDTEAKYFIPVDMDSGHWQVVAEEEAREVLIFFTLEGKQWWKVMLMGDLNASPTFVAMMMKLENEWYLQSKERGLKNVASKIIIDDVLLYGRTSKQLIVCFRTVLNFFKHHRATLELKMCKRFQDRC